MHYLRILDRHTDIYCAVFVLDPQTDRDRVLMDRNGWGETPSKDYLFLMKIAGDKPCVQWDPYEWGGGRTMSVAHHHLVDLWREKGWDYLTTLDIVDVQTVLKEKTNEVAD
jgi:hypothetical protein